MRDSGAKCLFTCLPLLETSEAACKTVGIPKNRIYILEMPEIATAGFSNRGYKTVDDLIKEGASLPKVEEVKLNPGDGAKRTAFLCYSSGTSGLPVSLYKMIVLGWSDVSSERSHDLSPQCHRQYRAIDQP